MSIEDTTQGFEAMLESLDRELGACSSNDERLAKGLETARSAADAERGFVAAPGGGPDEIRVIASHAIPAETLWSTGEISQTIVRKVFDKGEPIVSHNAMVDPRFSETTSVVLSGLRSVLCVPLQSEGKVIALLYLDNRLQAGVFGEEHLDRVRQVADRVLRRLE